MYIILIIIVLTTKPDSAIMEYNFEIILPQGTSIETCIEESLTYNSMLSHMTEYKGEDINYLYSYCTKRSDI